MFLIVCPLVFIASFVDAIAGGGGVISLSTYLLAGLPPHFAAGSNKFSAAAGSGTACVKFIKNGVVNWRVALLSTAGSLVGAVIGARLALLLDEAVLKTIMLAALPCVAVVMVIKRKPPVPKAYSRLKTSVLSALIGLVIGCYDGLVGPGTGTFLIIAFTSVLGFDLLLSSGCAKLSNFASNISSLIVYMINGKVVYALAAPAAACSMLGGYLGARFAIRGGSQKVRYVMFVVLALLFVKFGLDVAGVSLF
jgi:uncharacterized membrane protein YfcA